MTTSFVSSYSDLCGGSQLPEVVDGVMSAMTFATQTEVQAWEQEITPCEHTLCLEQDPPKALEDQSTLKCCRCVGFFDLGLMFFFWLR